MAKNKVVLVEDDEIIRGIYELILKDAGYQLVSATNGVEGLEQIKKHKPKLVLLDLMMPQMGGADMLRRLRQEDWGKDCKVLILTNIGKTEVPKDVLGLDVSDVLVKVDMTPDSLAEKIKSTLAEK